MFGGKSGGEAVAFGAEFRGVESRAGEAVCDVAPGVVGDESAMDFGFSGD